jgi:hypothetical protein
MQFGTGRHVNVDAPNLSDFDNVALASVGAEFSASIRRPTKGRWLDVVSFLRHETGARWPAFFSFIARIPVGALALLLPLLALSERMSPIVSAATLALCRIGQAVTGPLWGRLVDRMSLRVVLILDAAALCIAIVVLSIVSLAAWSILLLAALVGVLLLPMNALMRALWNRALTSQQDRQSATAFESGMAEGILLFGRLFVAISAFLLPIRVIIGSQTVMIAVGVAGLIGCAMLRSTAGGISGGLGRGEIGEVWELLRLFASFFLLSSSLGAFSFLLILGAGGQGATPAALAVAAWGAGSLIGLVVRSSRRFSTRRRVADPALLLAIMGVLQFLALDGHSSHGWLMTAAFVAGLPIQVIVTSFFDALGGAVLPDRQSEYFAWATTMLLAGDAAGAALAGAAFAARHSMTVAACVASASAGLSALFCARIKAAS